MVTPSQTYFKFELNNIEANGSSLMSKVETKIYHFICKYQGMNPTKLYLDPITYLTVMEHLKMTSGYIKTEQSNTVEKLFGVQIEVVPMDKEYIEFGLEDNRATALDYVYNRRK